MLMKLRQFLHPDLPVLVYLPSVEWIEQLDGDSGCVVHFRSGRGVRVAGPANEVEDAAYQSLIEATVRTGDGLKERMPQ